MRIAYFDCFAGISGDMALGALVDAGVDFDHLRSELAKLRPSTGSGCLHGFEIACSKVTKRGIAATSISVTSADAHHLHRSLSEIRELIASSDLSESVRQRATAIFTRLGEAEAKIHNTDVDNVHFHEVGAVDAIVDIVGVSICLDALGVERVYASPMPTFQGTVKGSHGVLPLPAPATMELLKDAPWREVGIEGELVTPTGAAIVSTLAERFGGMPGMVAGSVGYGAGKNDYGIPNVLRVFVGDLAERQSECAEVAVLETNIDDLNPQVYEIVMERLLAAGALDVYLTPIQMKKNRPATLVSVICAPEDSAKMADILFEETTTIGVRTTLASRTCLEREIVEVQTSRGPIRIKVAKRHGKMVNFQPEYDDCKAAAAARGVAVKTVQDEASAVFVRELGLAGLSFRTE